MSDHEFILKMIEEVSPDDTAKLDEIDARVFAVVTPNTEYHETGAMAVTTITPQGHKHSMGRKSWGWPQYTRSRDALKAIRPDGWRVTGISQGNAVCWGCSILPVDGKAAFDFVGNSCRWSEAPTEELAELHAIIQAIAYERQAVQP